MLLNLTEDKIKDTKVRRKLKKNVCDKDEIKRKLAGNNAFYKDPIVWLLLIFTGLVMSVILKSGFCLDDSILAYKSKYFVWITEKDIWAYIREEIQSWLNQGRFFPLSNIYVSLLMHYVKSAYVYKFLILLFVVLNVYVFGAFIRKLTKNRIFSLLVMMIVPICFQIRYYHDGLIAYHLLMQIVLFLLLVAAMELLRFLEKKKGIYLVVSLIPYMLGLLTYEAAYISFFFLFFLVFFYEAKTVRSAICWRNIKRTLFIMLPYFLIMAGLFFLTIHIRNVYGVCYGGIQPEYSIRKILITTEKQVLSAVPFSYHLLCNNNVGYIFHNNPILVIKTAKIQDYLAVLLLVALSFPCLKKGWKLKNGISLLGMGMTLLLAPALLIGISSKYQNELFWGIGHIPVYLEYFGMTIVGVLLAGKLLDCLKGDKLRRFFAFSFSFVLGSVLLVQMQDNRAVVRKLNNTYMYSQELFEQSEKAGIFSNLEDGSILLLENAPLYFSHPGKEYFSYISGKQLEVFHMEEFLEKKETEDIVVYILSYELDTYQQQLTLKEAFYCEGEFSVRRISEFSILRQE